MLTEAKWWVRQSFKRTRPRCEKKGRIDYMCIGGIWRQVQIVKPLDQRVNASADTDSKSTISTMLKRKRCPATQLGQGVNANYSITFQSVSRNEFYWTSVHLVLVGSQDFKCMCKHSCHEHNVLTRKCTRPNCKCSGFTSKHSCSCGMSYEVHKTVFETRAEREA